MVEINNQSRAPSICWRLRSITDVRNQKSWLWRHCRRRAIYWLLRSLLANCHAKPKTQINRRRTLPASSCWWDAYSAAWPERLLSESQDAVALQQIKERGAYLWLIVVISVRQSTVAAISGLHCRALVISSLSIRLTAWLQNSKKRAERSERLMRRAESPRLSPLWLSHHRLPVMGC